MDGPRDGTFSAATRQQLIQQWQQASEPEDAALILNHLAEAIAQVEPEVRKLVDLCSHTEYRGMAPDFPLLFSNETSPLIRHNLRLYYGRWLTSHDMINEAHQQLDRLRPQDVVDPVMLLFYQSVVAHRLVDKESCLARIDKLLENESYLPKRYVEVARLMRADMEPLEQESLDEVTRIMKNIRVRLDLGRAGKRVRTEEEEVLEKLEKMIDKIEQQAQNQSGVGGGDIAPSSPMQDSFPGGGKGPGDVDPKSIGHKADWGNLPPKERQEALQQISKDFPSHYREVIEEYFKKIAREGVRP